MLLGLSRSLWGYRGFVLGSVKREFQSRYRGSLFGALWTVLNPLSMIVVYTVIFSQVMRARLPGVDDGLAYSVYLCAGLLTWGLFAEITSRSQSMFIENANLLKKISFPRICLPVIVLLNAGSISPSSSPCSSAFSPSAGACLARHCSRWCRCWRSRCCSRRDWG